MDLPLITVITTVYRDRNTHYDAIRSVCSQKYPKIQYIIIDDGLNSVDEIKVRSIVDSTNKNICDLKIIHNEENLGTVRSLNKVMNLIEGKYIFNLADDDLFYDDKVLSDWVDCFISSGSEIVTAKRVVYDETMERKLSIEPTPEQISLIETQSPKKLFESMTGSNFIFGSSTARTKRILDLIGGYDESIRLIEDYSFNMDVLRLGYKISFFDRCVIKYRSGGTSSKKNIGPDYLEDSNTLFKKKILPFSNKKIIAIIRYSYWRLFCVSIKTNFLHFFKKISGKYK